MQDHAVIQIPVNPVLDHGFDFVEINHHAKRVKRLGDKLDFPLAVVAVQVAALALIIEKAMAVAKINLFGHAEHGLISLASALRAGLKESPCRAGHHHTEAALKGQEIR